MRIIAFMGQKGGTGKTTLAVHTAVAAGQDGHQVVLIDTDPQQSATFWGDNRKTETPVDNRRYSVRPAILALPFDGR